jgi:hypothetical protein
VRHAKLGSEVRGQMRHDVHRIADHQEHGVGRVTQDAGDNLPEDPGVTLQQLESCFTWLLSHAPRNDDHARTRQVGVVPRTDREWMRKRDGMVNVVGLRLRAGAVQVHEHNLPPHAAHDQRVSGGRPHHAATDNANFHGEVDPADVTSALVPASWAMR